MEIRDVIHGSITLEKSELPIIDSRYFQRLRHIKQLGFAEYSFPAATHNRFIHSLGTMETATLAYDTIFGGPHARSQQFASDRLMLFDRSPEAYTRFRTVLRLAALLHDVGHGPLSHTTESAMPEVRALWPNMSSKRKATHEDYTRKIIQNSDLTPIIEKAGSALGLRPTHVAALIDSSVTVDDNFFKESVDGVSINFRPILQQLVSSELDADRMDYLRRDSLHSGVSYGEFDFDWIISNLTSYIKNNQCLLALQHKALYSFEDFLISRFHMFLMVYFHYKTVVFDEMLGQYFASPDCNYNLPTDMEKYCECNDGHLYAHLAGSKNEWARRITEQRPYQMLVELHSGIPATKTAGVEQQRLLGKIERELQNQNIHYIVATSTSELSKYFKKPGNPIFVRYDNHYSAASFIPLEKCTDLFERYSEKRFITRLYVSPESYALFRRSENNLPLRYEDDSCIQSS